MYKTRNEGELLPLASTLAKTGILETSSVYSVAQVAKINTIMDGIFASRIHEARAYIRPDEMAEAGVLDTVLSRKMRDLILSIVPDPVLYHFHAYEISGKAAKSHIFGDQPGGWHRDPDSELFKEDPTHVSIFVYLSNVGEADGPFEFLPLWPDGSLATASSTLSMTGPIGTTFVWHRSYYHRAAPNMGPRRRRLIKISFQPNTFTSAHLQNPFFRRLLSKIPPGDLELDLLLGRYQGKIAPKLKPSQTIKFYEIKPNGSLDLTREALAKLKKPEKTNGSAVVAYD